MDFIRETLLGKHIFYHCDTGSLDTPTSTIVSEWISCGQLQRRQGTKYRRTTALFSPDFGCHTLLLREVATPPSLAGNCSKDGGMVDIASLCVHSCSLRRSNRWVMLWTRTYLWGLCSSMFGDNPDQHWYAPFMLRGWGSLAIAHDSVQSLYTGSLQLW